MDYEVSASEIKDILSYIDFELDFAEYNPNKQKNRPLSYMMTSKDILNMGLKDNETLETVFNRFVREKRKSVSYIYNKTGEHPSTYNRIASGDKKRPASDILLRITIILELDLSEMKYLFESAKSSITLERERIIAAFVEVKEYNIENIDYVLLELGEKTLFSKE